MSTNLTAIAVVAASLAAGYISLVRARRRNPHPTGYEDLSREEIYAKITLSDAAAISRRMAQLDFPRIYKVGLQFALFRTYAIPTISAILKKTRQLAEPENAGRRYADTVVLLSELMEWPLDSERASLAIARINYLHARYPQILHRDLIYTLLLFATQPIVFITRFEYRPPTEVEKAACWKFWYEVGLRMKLDPAMIPASMDEMMEALEDFEAKYMVPAESNNYVGTQTVELLLYWLPAAAKGLGRNAVSALVDTRLRVAMGFPEPPTWLAPVLEAVFVVRRWLTKNLIMPKTVPKPLVTEYKDPVTGRYFMEGYDNEPWYVRPTPGRVWSIWSLLALALGKPLVGQKGYGEAGYVIEQVGPPGLSNFGIEEVRSEAVEIRKMGDNRCPFA